MKNFMVITSVALTCMLALSASAEDGAKVTNLDASGGASAGHMIAFVGNQTSENNMIGTAYVCFMKEGKFDGAYGLHTEDDTATVGDVSGDVVKKTADKSDAKAVITHVDVTAEQYAKSQELVKKYRETKEHLDPPADVSMNCASEVLAALGMKTPYRSGLRAPNPVQFFGDVALTNRKLVKE